MRYQNWEGRLNDFFLSRIKYPFTWGQNDCALFSADAVLAMTGIDHAAQWRGKYDDAASATKIMKDGLESLVTLPQVNINQAHRGDVVLINHRERLSLGVIDLSGMRAASAGELGLLFLPISSIMKAWSV